MNTREVRWLNLKLIVKDKTSRKEFAEMLGYSNTNYLNQLLGNHSGMGSKTAALIEDIEALPSGWMSEAHPDLWESCVDDSPPALTYWGLNKLKTSQILDGIELMARIIKERSAEFEVRKGSQVTGDEN